jgi:hypothetical protein
MPPSRRTPPLRPLLLRLPPTRRTRRRSNPPIRIAVTVKPAPARRRFFLDAAALGHRWPPRYLCFLHITNVGAAAAPDILSPAAFSHPRASQDARMGSGAQSLAHAERSIDTLADLTLVSQPSRKTRNVSGVSRISVREMKREAGAFPVGNNSGAAPATVIVRRGSRLTHPALASHCAFGHGKAIPANAR